MSKKALYNLIQANFGSGNFTLPTGISLINKTHTSGTRYFLFDLPKPMQTRIDDLVLTSHHVSVYEVPTGKIDLKSQYHYTAYFQNASGEEYRLHVFFDFKDGLVTRPLLSILSTGDKYESVQSEDNDEEFTHLATTACNELISYLRTIQNNTIETLQSQLSELEKQLEQLSQLSNDQIEYGKDYLRIISDQIELLKELNKISNKSGHIVKQMRWLIASKEIIESSTYKPVTTREKEGTNEGAGSKKQVKATTSGKDQHKDKKASSSVSSTIHRVPVAKPAISDIVQQLKLRFMESKNSATRLSELYGDLKEKEWQLEFKEYTATARDLNDLRILKAEIEKSGKDLLERFLVLSDFRNAAILSPFYRLLPDNMGIFALTGNRYQLLDFLIKNDISSVNLKKFTIKAVGYSSMVDYCFKNNTPDNSMVDCLDVLIKGGVSLMEIDSATGLPYAALLLSQSKHPLRAALERNQELTLNNPVFYIKLNQVLRSLSSSSTLISIPDLIEGNKHKISLLKQRIIPIDNTRKLEASLGEELTHQIQSDPEISFQTLRIQRETSRLMKKLTSPGSKKLVASMAVVNFDLLENKINILDDVELIPPFEDIQRETIKLQLNILEFIALMNEAIDYKNSVGNMQSYSRKVPQSVKTAMNRTKEITVRLEEITEILDTAYEQLILEHASSVYYSRLVKKLNHSKDEYLRENPPGSVNQDEAESRDNRDLGRALMQGFANTLFAPGDTVVLQTVRSLEYDSAEESNSADSLYNNQ